MDNIQALKEMIQQIKDGKPLDSPPETIRLAKLVAEMVPEDINVEEWAARLAKDIANGRD